MNHIFPKMKFPVFVLDHCTGSSAGIYLPKPWPLLFGFGIYLLRMTTAMKINLTHLKTTYITHLNSRYLKRYPLVVTNSLLLKMVREYRWFTYSKCFIFHSFLHNTLGRTSRSSHTTKNQPERREDNDIPQPKFRHGALPTLLRQRQVMAWPTHWLVVSNCHQWPWLRNR